MHSAIKIANQFVERAQKAGLNEDSRLLMTQLQLVKITYVAHGWLLGLYDKPLFSEDVGAF